MQNITFKHWLKKTVCLTAGIAGLLSVGSAQAQVSLNSNVAFNIGTGVYTYSYSVLNGGPLFDLAIVDIPVGLGSNLLSLTAPTGFDINFDPGVGLVSFFEDANPVTPQTFAPGSTVGLFSFTSRVGPSVVNFTALNAGGQTFTGPASAPVPEPTTVLWALALAAPILSRRRTSTVNA